MRNHFELLIWIAYSAASFVVVFALIGGPLLWIWAREKLHLARQRYRRTRYVIRQSGISGLWG